jgi:predicted Zn-dependent protease
MAGTFLPSGMVALRQDLGNLIEPFQKHNLMGSVLLSSKRSLRVEIDNHVERVLQSTPKDGVVVTIFDGETVYERSDSGFDPDTTSRAISQLLLNVTSNSSAQVSGASPERVGDFITPMREDPADLSTSDKIDRLRAFHHKVRAMAKDLVNLRLFYAEENEYSVFRSQTADLAQRIQRLRLYPLVILAAEDGSRKYDVIIKSGTFGWEGLEFSTEELESFLEKARSLSNADRIEPGRYTIVTAPDVSGVICHESFGHGVETDMFLKDRARAASFLDRIVGSPLVEIYDNPGLPAAYGSYYFDDEGWPASSTHIVEKGVFRRGLTDFYSAAKLGLERTANGRRQDYTRKAYARMSNTYFGGGETSFEDIIAQVEDGVYLEKASAGVEDPLGWGIQLTCRSGREIRNGRLTDKYYTPVSMTGYVPDILKSITAVGDCLEMEGGWCGKGHKETIKVSSGGPHLLLKGNLS